MSPPAVTAVIPTLNESATLPSLLAELAAADIPALVVDGGSSDDTVEIAQRAGARVLRTRPGRALQLRAGAEAVDTPWLFFVHADTRLGPAAAEARAFVSADERDRYGVFGLAFDHPALFYRLLEWGQRLRDRRTGLAYGDQGLVVSRNLYDAVGGYPEWPMLEDVELIKRLASAGTRVSLSSVLTTSPRRYEARGRWRELAANVRILVAYARGASAHDLATRHPRPPEGDRARPAEVVIVFAKAPRPGFAKTRLSADVGAEEAMRIYRTLGSETVSSLGARFDLTVYHDVPDEEGLEELRAWLGRHEYRPQVGASLGERMSTALEEALRDADRACIVGTDVPGLGAEVVRDAFSRLSATDLVLGPAPDGGYYLLALRKHEPSLFTDVPWSTPDVLSVTLDRARTLGLSVALLPEMADVDRGSDVPPGLRSA